MSSESDNEGFDLAGFGKIAKAIPAKVYEQTAETALGTFEKLIAPITETTGGLGRYIRQKFDNMVDAEKALAIYTIGEAKQRAAIKAKADGLVLQSPQHTKSFVKSLEEASKETDPLLHEMWTNLLASQLVNGASYPHFVEVLPHFSRPDAELLLSLFPESEIGEHGGGYLCSGFNWITQWARRPGGEILPWTISCVLLTEFNFADVASSKDVGKSIPVMYRTQTGTAFLSAVTP